MLCFYNMSTPAAIDDLQDLVFKALADRRRRRILDLLREGEMTTGELCDRFPELDRCTVMQHLAVLERADLVVVRRQGRIRWNCLNALPIQELADRWIDRYAVPALRKLSRLRHELEGEEAPVSA